MRKIHVPPRGAHKCLKELPRHCWIIVGWNYEGLEPYQRWYNEVLGTELLIIFRG